MTGQDWSKSRVAARHITGTSMLVIKGPASTVLPQLDQAQQGAAIQIKGWHPTVTIGQILQQKFYGRDQLKGWHPTATIKPDSQQRRSNMLASYCHKSDAGTILLHTKLRTSLIRFSVGESHQCQIDYLSI
jgi:hypothetical protein